MANPSQREITKTASNDDLKDGIITSESETAPNLKDLVYGQPAEIDEAYLRASKTTKFWRSVLFQMILFGA